METTVMSKYPGSLMSDEAIVTDEGCGLPLFKVKEIFSDHDFNCRMDEVTSTDVIDLARSIADKGLIQPIVLRPCGEFDSDPEGYEYVVVAGYRRLQAYKVNNHPLIPAMVRQAKGKESYSIDNLVENLKRKNLNMLEEAKGIEPFYNSGWSRDAIAQKVGVSNGWVQVRCMVLDLEPEVQAEVATGILTTTHVRKLYSIKDREQQLAVALEIKKARQRGDISTKTVETILEKDKKPKAMTKKRRTAKEIEDMMEIIHKTFGEYGMAGRLLAWAAGQIANYEVFQDIKEEAREQGVSFIVPDFEF